MREQLFDILLSFPEELKNADDKDYCVNKCIENILDCIDSYRELLDSSEWEDGSIWID